MSGTRLFFLLMALYGPTAHAGDGEIVVGSKAFTEGYVLGEVTAETLEHAASESKNQIKIMRRFGMGGTGILYQALLAHEVDIYPEYTGTIAEAILKKPELEDWDSIQRALAGVGLTMSPSLGFNNTYGIAVGRTWAAEHSVATLSDLARTIEQGKLTVRAGFSHEFMTRKDGYSGLVNRYRLKFSPVSSMEHSLAYEAIEQQKVDAIDVYSTDAKIEKLNLVTLIDDLHYFPKYEAVLLSRLDFVTQRPKFWTALLSLGNTLTTDKMIHMNRRVDIDRESFATVVSKYLGQASPEVMANGFWSGIWMRTKEHLVLVGVSLFISILIGLPLGIIAFQTKRLAQAILLISGILQTIPSLALLSFLIPFFGVGTKAALIALILYSLLPIILNTYVGLQSVEPAHRENARALGLTYWQRLRYIELPLSSASILTGIKTSATIGIGTATLAALIGAGGYGVPIVTGLAINDTHTILTGAVPAALMAFAAHGIFELLSRWLVPKVGQSPNRV